MKREQRRIVCRDGAITSVKQMAERGTARSERLVARAAVVVRSMEVDGPPSNTVKYKLRQGRMLYVYKLAGVRFEFFDDGRTIEIIDIEFKPRESI